MSVKSQKILAAISASSGVFGIAAWFLYFQVFKGFYGGDWLVYYSAIRAALEGHLHLLYDGVSFTAALNTQFADWLARPLPLHPWLYPPHYLLLLAPFGLLPPGIAYGAFLVGTFASMAAALLCLTKDKGERLLHVLAAIVSPAAAVVVWDGQNTFLTVALLVGGFALAKKRPLLAGALLGVLTYKPQFWLMVPIALIASRQWKALAAAVVSAGALVLISLAAFGPGPWLDWFHLMIAPNALFNQWQATIRINGQSLYACARVLGAGVALANGVQLMGTMLSAFAVWLCFKRPFPSDLRVALLLAATVIGAPHIMWYDTVLLCVAASLFLAYSLRRDSGITDMIIATGLWLSPLFGPPNALIAGVMTPVLAALFILRILECGSGQKAPFLFFGAKNEAAT